MKITPYSLIFLVLVMGCFAYTDVSAQGKKTIVLVRHVERDVSPTADKVDPDLSDIGRQRAERLVQLIKKYKPHEIFSTNFKRTRFTAEPIAKRRKVEIQTYDPGKQNELVEKIAASKTEHFLVVGHSNTIPLLANLLTKKEVFKQMPETEFGVIWVIRLNKGVLEKVEVFGY